MNPQQPTVVVIGGGPQPQPQPAPQTVVHTVSQAPPTVQIQESNGLRHKDSHKILGIIQMVAGSLCLSLSIIGFIVGSPKWLSGSGIYTGILFFLAGLFGFLASYHEKNPGSSRCFIITCMIMNIIGACAAVSGIGDASVELAINSGNSPKESFQRAKGGIVLFIIIFEFVTTIVHASFTCSSCCQCCMPREVVYQPAPLNGTVVVQHQQVGSTMAPAGQSPMPLQQYTAQQPMQAQSYPQSTYPQQHNAAFSPDDSMGASAPLPPPYSESDLEKK